VKGNYEISSDQVNKIKKVKENNFSKGKVKGMFEKKKLTSGKQLDTIVDPSSQQTHII